MEKEKIKAEELRKRRCHNCQFAGVQFKIDKLTHLHCLDPKEYDLDTNPWETLRVFNNTCDNHQFKLTPKE